MDTAILVNITKKAERIPPKNGWIVMKKRFSFEESTSI